MNPSRESLKVFKRGKNMVHGGKLAARALKEAGVGAIFTLSGEIGRAPVWLVV